jgi:hypothetical protein
MSTKCILGLRNPRIGLEGQAKPVMNSLIIPIPSGLF